MEVKPKAACRFDLVSLGEVMLRLDPGQGHIHTARRFEAWEGGDCFDQLAVEFFETGRADVSCLVRMRPPPFYVP